jgi:glycosyltransferase involved in cell wall biosynthesis
MIFGGGEKFIEMIAHELLGLGYVVEIRSPKLSMLRKKIHHVQHFHTLKPVIGGKIICNDFRSLWKSILIDRSVTRVFVVHGGWQISQVRLKVCKLLQVRVATISQDLLNQVQKLEPTLVSTKLDFGPEFLGYTKSDFLEDATKSDTERVTIGTIARLDPVKNLSLFNAVIESMNAIGIETKGKLLTPAPLLNEELAMLSTLSSDISVVHDQSPESFLKSIDLFLSTSVAESLGLAHLEALASKKPVVSTASGGPSEFLIEYLSAGYMPYELDAERIAKNVLSILKTSNQNRYWESAEKVLKSRGPKIMVRQLVSLL